ncbi:MAG: DUF389 domain-containing protein [Myxococcales bacterium]|nr:DUF389 domain-containing protein [Myxococcales bacterium]
MAILAVVTETDVPRAVIALAWHVAQARREGLTIVRPARGVTEGATEVPLQPAEGEKADALIGAIRSVANEALAASETQPETPALILRSVANAERLDAVLAEVRRLEPTLLVVAWRPSQRGDDASLAQQLFDRAPCDVMAVGPGEAGRVQRILVPTSGGPNARVALSLAAEVARHHKGTLTALHVEPEAMEDAELVGGQVLKRALARAGVEAPSASVEARTVVSSDVRGAICEAAAQNDVVLLGASNRSIVTRLLFGTLPERVQRGPEGTVVAVVRHATPWSTRLRDRVERLLALNVPQMSRGDRVELFEKVQNGSRWSFDFMALIGLSTSIAALGLIQSSGAVVIGAMLVAPLMTPLLGSGLALLQGNQVLLKNSTKAIVLGFLMALALGLLMGLLSPIKVLTPELAARGGPNLLDLGIAFLSGTAAAYAYARPHLIAALPGVAIAAALVPPVATTGISLAWGEMDNAKGAALLFGTNVVAIILGSALTWYAAGIRGRSDQRLWARRTLAGLALVLVGLTVPLGSYLVSLVQRDVSGFREDVAKVVGAEGFGLVGVHRRDGVIEVEVRAPTPAPPALAASLADKARARFDAAVTVRVVTRLTTESGGR